ncbi:MAG: hypothetical protein WC136_00330 [Sphaerochaeta sp.]|jgi:hypothetical protein
MYVTENELTEIPVENQTEVTKEIGGKREKKIKVSVQDVEKIIKSMVSKYDADVHIETFIESKLDNLLSYDQIRKNNELKNANNYVYQFDNTLFEEIYEFIYPYFQEIIQKDLQDTTDTDLYELKEKVYENIYQVVDLTMYKTGISKLKLVAYHYLLKVLERRADIIMNERDTKNIRGYKTSIEIFSFELLNIIGTNTELEKFTLTIRSLIEQWIVKYNNRSKIGKFYYSILMINQEHIIEKILRYMMFTAIKNMNPIYLRAIFSTYITLIHKNIFSFYALKLSTVKVGYFKQLESMFDDDIIQNTHHIDSTQMLIQNQLLNYSMINKRYLKHNFELVLDEYNSSFMDTNYFDLLYSYDKEIPILDYMFYYQKFLKITKNSFRSQSNLYKLNSDYFKMNNKKTLKIYIKDLIYDKFANHFMQIFEDIDVVDIVCENISTNLLKKINQHNFVTSDFNKLNLSFDDYLNQLGQLVTSMKKLV